MRSRRKERIKVDGNTQTPTEELERAEKAQNINLSKTRETQKWTESVRWEHGTESKHGERGKLTTTRNGGTEQCQGWTRKNEKKAKGLRREG